MINKTQGPQDLTRHFDIICIQEPWTDKLGNARQGSRWDILYPSSRLELGSGILLHSVLLVNKKLSTSQWQQFDVPNTNDVTAIKLSGPFSRLTIINIYNDGTHSTTLRRLREHLERNRPSFLAADNDYILWCGDFNHHHPRWDDPANYHLFTATALEDSEILISFIDRFNLEQILPPGVPTFRVPATGNWTRPDNVFLSTSATHALVSCSVAPEHQANGADHVPIVTVLDLPVLQTTPEPRRNFRMTDWKKFQSTLDLELARLPPLLPITTKKTLNLSVTELTAAIQRTITMVVPVSRPCARSRRWWTSELSVLKRKLNRLNNLAYKCRALPSHPVHLELADHARLYKKCLFGTKDQHWESFLDEVTEDTLFTAARYATSPGTDSMKSSSIPTLREKDSEGRVIREAATNESKADWLAETFFPSTPRNYNLSRNPCSDPLPSPLPITSQCIVSTFQRMEPYKAPGPDGIQNIVLRECATQLAPYLVHIYNSFYPLKAYPDAWLNPDVIVLRKPGKASYTTPKAFRPISLYNTMRKGHSTIVTEDISYLAEKHGLLPLNQFGGRPGRMTTDSLHMLADPIRNAHRNKREASVLSLDIEGAFPNAVTERVLYNMRKRRIPESLVTVIGLTLKGARARLRFGDSVSDPFNLTNGIGQGEPESMIIYLFYNADFFDIPITPKNRGLTVGFVDDKNIFVESDSMKDNVTILRDFMEKPKGGFAWSDSHNSKFSLPKLVVIHFPRTKNSTRAPPLTLRGHTVQEQQTVRILGIIFDSEMSWRAQSANALAKATSIVSAFWKLSRPSNGISMKMMRRLYISVVIPKMTYGLDVWYTPPHLEPNKKQRSGSIRALQGFGRVQRQAMITITGALRSSPSDLLEIHSKLLPIDLLLEKICHRSLIRIYTLPVTNPLAKIAAASYKKRHITKKAPTLRTLPRILEILSPDRIETITPPSRPKYYAPNFEIRLAADKKDARQMALEDNTEVKIFTDGSGIEGQAGAAAVLSLGAHEAPLTLRYHLGSLEEHTSFDAEGVGVILGIHLLRSHFEDFTADSCLIGLDGKSFIEATQGTGTRTGQALVEQIHRMSWGLARDSGNDKALTLTWIPGHVGIKGNEMADKEAKHAAQGNSSVRTDLPHFLRRQLPASAAALKQTFNKRLHDRWSKKFDTSPRRDRLAAIDDKGIASKFLKIAGSLSKRQSSVLIQLRTNHVSLRKHLHHIKKAADPFCPHCDLRGQKVEETVKHFILECPAYKKERFRLFRGQGRGNNSLKSLFANSNSINKLLQYIGQTGRLRSSFGDVSSS